MKVEEVLLQFINEHPAKEIKKGFNLFSGFMYEIDIQRKSGERYLVEVPSQSGWDSYTVLLIVNEVNVKDSCECMAFEQYGQCKHALAAAFTILMEEFRYNEDELEVLTTTNSRLKKPLPAAIKSISEKQSKTKAAAKKPGANSQQKAAAAPPAEWKAFICEGVLNHSEISRLSGNYFASYLDLNRTNLTAFDEQELHWQFSFKDLKKEYRTEIKYDTFQTYFYCCTCQLKSKYPVCRHVSLAFEKLLQETEINYFLQFKNWTAEKNILLQPYGLTIADEESNAFQFKITYSGGLQLEAPAAYIKGGDKEQLKNLGRRLRVQNNASLAELVRPRPLPQTIIDFETAFVFNANSQRLKLGFELEAAKLYQQKDKRDLKKLSINQPPNLPLLKGLPDEVYALLLQLSDMGLLNFLQSQGYGHLKQYANPWPQMTEAVPSLLKKHYVEVVQQLWPHLAAGYATFLLKEGKFSSVNCKPATFSNQVVTLSFSVTTDSRFITIWQIPVVNEEPVTNSRTEILHDFIFCINGVLHLIKNMEDLPVVEQFSNGFIKVPIAAKYDVIQDIIAPLQERFSVQLPEGFSLKTISVQPQPQVLLKEYNNQYLMLLPQFLYEETLVDYSSQPEDIVINLPDGSMQIIKRNAALEKQFLETLRPLHPTFSQQRQNDFFYVHFNEVMKGNWFLNAVRYLQENDITVKGMQELKRFRYNTHTPKWEMKAGSGIDWFDLQVKISFGAQEVSLKEVRKALLSRQNMVVLGDGTFGVLPDEWLEQYGMLLKMGDEQKDGSLRLSKLHFTLIDELHAQIDDSTILQEIEAKKQKLKNVENIKTKALSKNIKAQLRPYQLSGFQWMQTLDELAWGGCLADDMGLGKTLQTISFLQYAKEKYKGSTHLVVCPTSLVYNWEAELKKFAPRLRYHVYYGAGRSFTDAHFESYDVVITSYGLVRNDMEQLLQYQWHYVILDESQAIKNPDAQTTRAVQLLKSKNRLILSGTPVQNNTFDLFAQFNFLNPGLLGSKEFFKTEFANPIDKYNDAGKSSQLRRLVYPFLLRRTKAEVAKDLPDKTEAILWCQLPKEQRSVYEDYKNYYRRMLLQKIEEEGMSKAGIYVLEGLLRLRQICDSPQLLKDAEVTTRQSIKTEELMREVEENTGSHKLLVFSQFTEMLHLIETALKEKNMTYCYLDGSTPADKRRQQVEAFQTDAGIKIFLISLKAGGVGLNLTAADYVYIVDPWWNPAVEQQAIDRTHRIGQTQKIIAYKMICKDTVEEKILHLQQRKKQLANELVTEDAGFVKKLTREDVEFLFT